LISRSVRYHGNYGFWENNLPIIKNQSLFVGLEKEHEIFEYTFSHKVEYYKTPTILELAEVIAGCDLFISNANLCHALAEGLKKNLIIEQYRVYPTVIFDRIGAKNV
jgi:hypothetical protein